MLGKFLVYPLVIICLSCKTGTQPLQKSFAVGFVTHVSLFPANFSGFPSLTETASFMSNANLHRCFKPLTYAVAHNSTHFDLPPPLPEV